MKKANVLVLGESGVGKSTLINAVIGEEVAVTGIGTEGTTKELKIYESDLIPFRLIDSIGFEPSPRKRNEAINAVKKWSKEYAKEDAEGEEGINVIWFCIEGTRGKLFPEMIKNLSKAASFWKTVPVIVVITKSYSVPDREQNINLVYSAIAAQKHTKINLQKVIPVVAQTFQLNDMAYAPPEGITELIDCTNAVIPEGLKAAENDLSKYKLNRKRVMAHSVVAAATAAGVVVGAVPIPVADGALLVPTETTELKFLSRIYEIDKNNGGEALIKMIIETGTVGMVAKAIISGLKAIPYVNIAASALNAIVAGVIVATIGEVSIQLYEQIYTGKMDADNLDKAKTFIKEFISKIDFKSVGKSVTGDNKTNKKLTDDIIEAVTSEKGE